MVEEGVYKSTAAARTLMAPAAERPKVREETWTAAAPELPLEELLPVFWASLMP